MVLKTIQNERSGERQDSSKRSRPNYWRILGYVGWLWPLFMLAGGYAFPAMRETVSLATLPNVYGHLLVSVLIAIAWVGVQVKLIVDRKTPISALQFDAALATTLSLVLTGFLGMLAGNGTLAWWFVVPWAAAVIDTFTSAGLAINNAATRRTLQDDSFMN